MSKINAARGTQDIVPPDSNLWQEIETKAMRIFNAAGYSEVRTPIFEATELFARAVGESSDIVNKEMYTFSDRSDRSLTLRPEATAAIVRAYIEHNLGQGPRPFKAWYRGPMFRYERPQTGRYRQFHQIGIEALGASSVHLDLELIALGLELLQELGLQGLSLHINSLGTAKSRVDYREALVKFLKGVESQICEDCKRRLEQNPLRVLDCKVPADQALYANAPLLHDYYDEESQQVWQEIQAGISKLNLGADCKIDPKLVRGLDYYNHLVFEIKSSSPSLGQQSTVLAGGRYDSLVETLGGDSTPAAGWALGIERLVLLINEIRGNSKTTTNNFFIVSDDLYAAQTLAFNLRKHPAITKVEYDFDNAKIGKQLEKATKRGADFAIIYLESERATSKLEIKSLEKRSEIELSIGDFANIAQEILDALEKVVA